MKDPTKTTTRVLTSGGAATCGAWRHCNWGLGWSHHAPTKATERQISRFNSHSADLQISLHRSDCYRKTANPVFLSLQRYHLSPAFFLPSLTQACSCALPKVPREWDQAFGGSDSAYRAAGRGIDGTPKLR
jgi:hypothetical protein